MACSILTSAGPARWARRWCGIALAAAVLHGAGASAQPVCPSGARAAGAVATMTAHSPLYELARKRIGPVRDCRASKDADTETLVLSFAQGATLTVSTSPAIELATQTLALGEAVLPRGEAMAALRRTETEQVGAGGCGIPAAKWRAATAARGAVQLDGDACNCKASLQATDGKIVGLSFSTAC